MGFSVRQSHVPAGSSGIPVVPTHPASFDPEQQSPTMSGSTPLEQPNRLKLSRQCLKLSKTLLSLKNLTQRNYKNRICISNIISEGPEHSWFTTWPPYTEGKETPKKEAENSRLVCVRLNKQGNLPARLVLGAAR